jgi:DNA-binding transcriptional ArsR family regulator
LSERAAVFAALGDATRLGLLGRLAKGEAQSISRLAEGSPLTRQAVSKHLAVLEGAGLVRRKREGRESLYAMRPERLRDAFSYLDDVAQQWEDALGRLKSFLEN